MGDTVTAYGTFTADLTGGATVSLGSGSGNTMTIDVNGGGSDPFPTFDSCAALTDFDFSKTGAPACRASTPY